MKQSQKISEAPYALSPQEKEVLQAFPEPLLNWYDKNARVLPWRSDPQPYWVWISEIMLQQTRVEAGLPYFIRFVRELPDVAALAAIPEEQLLKLWEGLGYYSRARNLQKAARMVMEQHGGELPGDFQALEALPGIGTYTAGAIASIAFDKPVPAVDGNVLRVVLRLLDNTADSSLPAVKKAVGEWITRVIPHDRPGDFNQAIMDLGAGICLPKAPKCLACPASAFCQGYANGTAPSLPVKPEKKPRKQVARTVLAVVCKGRILLQKRPDKGLLAGLWELPGFEEPLDSGQVEQKIGEWGLAVSAPQLIGQAKHVFSHVEWHMTGWLLEPEEPWEVPPGLFTEEPLQTVWADSRELAENYTLPSAFAAYRQAVEEALEERL
ncbi:A/G-specific adenine glycosylase [Oscillospiraceae bacterium MB08-C2-2]|nr:A/G-specific adenine glycosylase [Oscillospiraceae bacterium MB08-C2-2]